MGQRQPVAYFQMHLGGGLSLPQVHGLLREVIRQLGSTDCGEIKMSGQCHHGHYTLVFYRTRAADLFERLCGKEGYRPRRSAQLTSDMHIPYVETLVVESALVDLNGFMRRMMAPLN